MADQAATNAPPEESCDDVDKVIATFDGDTRAAIRSLLIANEFLIGEVDRLRTVVSVGYGRGKPRPASSHSILARNSLIASLPARRAIVAVSKKTDD